MGCPRCVVRRQGLERGGLTVRDQTLRSRESAFQDAKKPADRHDGKVDHHGEPCTFEIRKAHVHDFSRSELGRAPNSTEEALRFIGLETYVDGSVNVRNGRIMETEFEVVTEAKLGHDQGAMARGTGEGLRPFSAQ
jgi:hypothetical protein